jgi:hypothetical protein
MFATIGDIMKLKSLVSFVLPSAAQSFRHLALAVALSLGLMSPLARSIRADAVPADPPFDFQFSGVSLDGVDTISASGVLNTVLVPGISGNTYLVTSGSGTVDFSINNGFSASPVHYSGSLAILSNPSLTPATAGAIDPTFQDVDGNIAGSGANLQYDNLIDPASGAVDAVDYWGLAFKLTGPVPSNFVKGFGLWDNAISDPHPAGANSESGSPQYLAWAGWSASNQFAISNFTLTPGASVTADAIVPAPSSGVSGAVILSGLALFVVSRKRRGGLST